MVSRIHLLSAAGGRSFAIEKRRAGGASRPIRRRAESMPSCQRAYCPPRSMPSAIPARIKQCYGKRICDSRAHTLHPGHSILPFIEEVPHNRQFSLFCGTRNATSKCHIIDIVVIYVARGIKSGRIGQPPRSWKKSCLFLSTAPKRFDKIPEQDDFP